MKKYRLWIGFAAAILIVGIIGSLYILYLPRGTQVNIVQDGTVLYSFDLSMAKNQTLEIAYEGRINTIQIEDGKIRVLDADCPDQTCVHMGWLKSGALPIVCLPNHLLIEYTQTENEVDAIVR